MDQRRLRSIARRALARARAQMAGTTPDAPRVTGCLLSVEDLQDLPRGTRLRVARGTRITPLARDEAWTRGITLVEELA